MQSAEFSDRTGKYDRFISSKLGNEIAEKLPNARLEVINKAGHYVHMDKPVELVQVVTEFLDEVPDEVARLVSNG